MNRFAILALGALLCVPALAQDQGYGYGQYGREHRGNDDQRGPRHGYSEAHGKRYVNIGAEVCGVTEVRIVVRGDNLNINDVDVLFGNGATQNIPVRRSLSAGQASRWIRMSGGARCVKGLFLDATGDADRQNATVTLQARMPAQYDYTVNISEPILVRDFGRRWR
jgi:hypothetical protein